jgi:acetyl esterase/lipase
MILVYPVISMKDGITHHDSKQWLLGKDPNSAIVQLLSNETQVTPQTPPTFLVHADDDDCVIPQNSIYFYTALRKAHVPAEMHIFCKGGHGFALLPDSGPAGQWPVLCENWMRQLKILQAEEKGD